MYRKRKILALIPARGGSKGIKNKNIAPLLGKPLLAYTIIAAQKAACFDDIVVSTDSNEIADVARDFGALIPFMRPADLALDESKGEPVASHALKVLAEQGRQYDLLVYLQPTSPLREARDILGALDFFIDHDLSSLTSVSPVTEHPLYMRSMGADNRLVNLLDQPSDVRRQDLPPFYILNGAVYINHAADVLSHWRGNDNQYGYIMNAVNGLDINTPDDLARAEHLLSNKLRNSDGKDTIWASHEH